MHILFTKLGKKLISNNHTDTSSKVKITPVLTKSEIKLLLIIDTFIHRNSKKLKTIYLFSKYKETEVLI